MAKSKMVVAVIEDDAEDNEFFCSALSGRFSHIEVTSYLEPADFLKMCAESDRLPDLVVTDLRMPFISGFDIIRQLKADKATMDIPVVVLSTSGRIEDRENAAELGALAYFVKPYVYSEYDVIARQIMSIGNFN